MEEKWEIFEAKVNLRFNQMDNRIGSLQSSIDYLTTLMEQSSRNFLTNSHILDGSILTESAEPDMRQRLEDLKEITPNTTTLTELEREVNDGLDELKTWAGNEPENRTPISHSFLEAELDSESDISFAIIPSDVQPEAQPEVENVDRKSPIQNVKSEIGIIEDRSNSAASTMSFECIDSLADQSESDFSMNNESVIEAPIEEPKEENKPEVEPEVENKPKVYTETGENPTNVEDEKLKEAVRRQALAIRELIDSQISSNLDSFSRQTSTTSSVVDVRQRDEETSQQIAELAAEIDRQSVIKRSVCADTTPHNSRDTTALSSFAPSTVGMEQVADFGSFPTYNSFSEIPTYIPPQPTPLPTTVTDHDQVSNNQIDQQFGLQVDLDQDNRALEAALAVEPTEAEIPSRTVDVGPRSGLDTLRAEFGTEYDQLSGAALRKMDYDSSRAAQFMRSKDLPTQFLVAKLRLQDLDINVNDSALAQLCVTYDNISQVISDYIDVEFNQERVVLEVDGAQNGPNTDPWTNIVDFVNRTANRVFR